VLNKRRITVEKHLGFSLFLCSRKELKMKIEVISINKLKPAVYNPRVSLKPGDKDYEKLKNSIATFGYVEPIVWNRKTGNVVGGHQRAEVLKQEGYEEVEVVVVELSLDKEKSLNLALNKISGRWDEEKLSLLLSELTRIPDFDVGLTGFEMPEITNLFDKFNEKQDDDFDFSSELNNIETPVTQKGELIELGSHRLLCGDSSKEEDIKRLLSGQKVRLIHTDPPYNVNYYGGNRPTPKARPKNSRHWERIYSDDMTQEQYEQWLKNILSNTKEVLQEGAPFYIWNGHKQFGPMHQMLTALDLHVACVITWAKPNFAIGYGDYNQQTEFCLYGWKKGNAHFWNGPTNESTLWEIHRDSTKQYIHPTQKPIALAQRAMRNSSQHGDVVFDLFLGSGSTLIAAESLGRRCFGIEIDPKYCDAIVRRYISFVGIDKVSGDLRKKFIKEVKL